MVKSAAALGEDTGLVPHTHVAPYNFWNPQLDAGVPLWPPWALRAHGANMQTHEINAF